MDAGRVQESGPVRAVLGAPRTACTKELLEASRPHPPSIAVAGESLGLAPSRDILDAGRRHQAVRSNGRGTRPALADVRSSLREGEILGVLGQSGSGKSTLARLLLGA